MSEPVAYRYDYLTRRGENVAICRTSPWPEHKREGWTETPLYPEPVELVAILAEIMRFHKGECEYNFASLSDYDRANAIDDAWYPIRDRIEAALAKWGRG